MALPTTPLISIVTLNYNQTPVTIDFLKSTQLLRYRHFETLVCDMGSAVDPTEEIEALNIPNTKVLRSEENLGFTGGNNWGMRQAKGDFLFIVNNDTEVTPTLLDELLKPFYEDEKIGFVSPKIRFFHHPNVIQYAGFNHLNLLTGRATAVGSLEEDKGQHDVSGITNGAHGCAMLVKREVIDKVGMFPEKFFIYYEEWDWSARVKKAGYKIYYQASALIFHKESITMGKKSAIKVYYHTRNRIMYMRRNTNFLQYVSFLLFFTFLTVPKSLATYLLKGQSEHLKAFVRGIVWNFKTSSYSPV